MHHLSKEEVRRLLTSISGEHERAALAVAYLHGLRVSELIALTAGDVREGYLTIRRGKGGRKCTQKLVGGIDPLFNEETFLPKLTKGLEPSSPIFGQYRMYWHRVIVDAAKKAGIESRKAHMHTLRHSAAMTMLKAGAGLETIQRRLGHVSLSSTGHYLHVTDDEASEKVQEIFS